MNLLFYCHNSLGIGHLTRTYKLASAFRDSARVAVVCGGKVPSELSPPPGVELLSIPPVSMGVDGDLYANDTEINLASVLAERELRLVNIAHEFGADVLIVEMFPFGRRKFSSEILALINTVRARPMAKVLCSVRDVLVSRPNNQVQYDRRAVRWLNRYFDGVLVHSDPCVVPFASSFSAYAEIEVPIHYTGYVSAEKPCFERFRDPVVVVSAGGGRVGHRLVEVAQQSAAAIRRSLALETLIVSGSEGRCAPQKGSSDYKMSPFIPNLSQRLARSTLSVSQCGYNTATDVLVAEVAAVFVPFETPSEDEQLRRASVFSAKRRGVCLRETDLRVSTLIEAAEAALVLPRNSVVALGGVLESAQLIRQYHGR